MVNLLVSLGCIWSCLLYKNEVPIQTKPFINGLAVPTWFKTNAVVAICVVHVLTEAVGAFGMPVNVWPEILAFKSINVSVAPV